MMALTILFGVLMFAVALLLILLVLVQRGRGGGLAGALGGMGGQSAFGTKAGDLFTRVTMIVATVWILLCILAILVLNPQRVAAPETGNGRREYVRAEAPDEPVLTGEGGMSANDATTTDATTAEAVDTPAGSPPE
jgi:preprotein translocase subunit SecG